MGGQEDHKEEDIGRLSSIDGEEFSAKKEDNAEGKSHQRDNTADDE